MNRNGILILSILLTLLISTRYAIGQDSTQEENQAEALRNKIIQILKRPLDFVPKSEVLKIADPSFEEEEVRLKEIIEIGANAVPILIELLKTKGAWRLSDVIWALGALKSETAILALTGMKCSDRYTKGLIVSAVGKIGGDRAIAFIERAFADERTRDKAREAFIRIGSDSVIPLCRLLKSESAVTRENAVWALQEIMDKRSTDALIEVLQDDDNKVRGMAAYALGLMKCRKAVRPIAVLLNDESWDTPMTAGLALGLIGDPEAVEYLIPYAERYSAQAADALIRIGTPAVDQLIPALGQESTSIRRCAAEALGGIGDGRALTPLLQHLRKETDEEVKEEIIKSLSAFQDETAHREVQKIWEETDVLSLRLWSAYTLARGWQIDEAALFLVNQMKSADERTRSFASSVLMKLSRKRSCTVDYDFWKRWYDQAWLGKGTKGTVIGVSEKVNLVVINIGEEDGVRVGEDFAVFRGNALICELRVFKIYPNQAACKITADEWKGIVRIADEVRRSPG